MWSNPTASVTEWEAALKTEETRPECVIAAANCLCAALRFNEVLVGGDDSPCMVQVLAAGSKEAAADADALASVLLPTDEVTTAYTTRGEGVQRLLVSFWLWRPRAPTLLPRSDTYQPLFCCLRGVEQDHWSVGPLCAEHVRMLQNSQEGVTTHDQALQILTPGPPPGESAPANQGTDSSAASRAAIVRPDQIRQCETL